MKGTVSDPSWSSNRYTDWNLHVFGLSLGARTLPSAPIAGLKSLVLPVEYIRCVETRYILQHLDVRPASESSISEARSSCRSSWRHAFRRRFTLLIWSTIFSRGTTATHTSRSEATSGDM